MHFPVKPALLPSDILPPEMTLLQSIKNTTSLFLSGALSYILSMVGWYTWEYLGPTLYHFRLFPGRARPKPKPYDSYHTHRTPKSSHSYHQNYILYYSSHAETTEETIWWSIDTCRLFGRSFWSCSPALWPCQLHWLRTDSNRLLTSKTSENQNRSWETKLNLIFSIS
jgi:hypothetical protein